MNDQTYPIVFACCIPVLGATRAMICDIQRQAYHFIPDSMFEVLSQHKGKTLGQIKAAYNQEYDEIIEEYFDFLVQKEYVFFSDTPELFPEMDMRWEEPVKITNAIIDLDNNSPAYDFINIFEQLEALGCEHIQLRSFTDRPLSFFENILKCADRKRIISIDLIIKYQAAFSKRLLFDFCNQYPRVFSITAHSAAVDETLHISEQGMGHIFLVSQQIDSEAHCGMISTDFFTINIKSFTEALAHNSCLNRKISIDKNGEIKNCPSMSQSFGNIKNTTLTEALAHPDFKQYWNINKDQIEVCKDCEFRYICTDCRAYVEDPNNKYSKPAKCGYDPYTATWAKENASANILHGQ